jgi:hypothetical protein
LSKLPENYFEPVRKGGWPPISTWINHPSQKEKVQLQVMNFFKEGSYRNKKEEENQKIDLSSQINSRMETPSVAISFLVITLAIKQCTTRN